MHKLIAAMYEIPFEIVLVMMMTAIIVWSVLSYYLQRKAFWLHCNRILCLLSVGVIYLFTLSGRLTKDPSISLVPFYSFYLASVDFDVYIQMMLNALLFFPLGLTLPFAVYRHMRFSPLITVLCSILISVSVEILQYYLGCGYSEIDDVIFNVSGACVGTLSYALFLHHNRSYPPDDQDRSPIPKS